MCRNIKTLANFAPPATDAIAALGPAFSTEERQWSWRASPLLLNAVALPGATMPDGSEQRLHLTCRRLHLRRIRYIHLYGQAGATGSFDILHRRRKAVLSSGEHRYRSALASAP